MAGLGKKKLQIKAKQAEKRAAKKKNNQGEGEQPSSSSSNPGKSISNVQVVPPDEWFSKLKNDVLDCGSFENVLDGLLRKYVRVKFELRAPRFASLSLLRGKNLVYIQLVVIDTDRSIQVKLYTTGSEVFKGYDGVIEKAVQFPSYDPTDDLLEPPKNPFGIHCAEVFLFVAGDFVKEDGLCSRDAVKKLLHELNSKEGISKLLAFDVVAASVVVSKEKLEELKDVHLSLIA